MIIPGGPYRGAGGDPFFADVSLLLHFDGTNGQTTTVDSSGSPHAVVLTSATLSTTQAAFGPSSLVVAASTSGQARVAATVSPPDNLQLGSNEWTVEFWIYPTGTGAAYAVNFAASNTYSPFTAIYRPTGMEFEGFPAGGGSLLFDISTNGALTLNAWSFIQARRRNGVLGNDVVEIAVNGVQQTAVATFTAGTALYQTNNVDVGGTGSVAFPVPGFVDEFRLTNGVARSFNLPTAPFPNF